MTEQEQKPTRIRISAETAAEIRKTVAEGARQADVARAHGFWHLSEFSAAYCATFGELPSETILRKIRA